MYAIVYRAAMKSQFHISKAVERPLCPNRVQRRETAPGFPSFAST